MAFTCTAYKFWAEETSKAVSPQVIQYMALTLTPLAADVAMDVGNTAGTFWSEVDNDAIGLAAFNAFKKVIPEVQSILEYNAEFIMGRLRVAVAGGATEYSQAFTAGRISPDWTFAAAAGITADVLTIGWVMKPGWIPVTLAS